MKAIILLDSSMFLVFAHFKRMMVELLKYIISFGRLAYQNQI